MRRFQWNALGVGDRVRVHETAGPQLTSGTVSAVNVVAGSNGIGILMEDIGEGSRILWPSRVPVHLEHIDPDEYCWRCEVGG